MSYGLMNWNENRRPGAKAIAEENQQMRQRQEHFRIAAEYVAEAFGQVHDVQRVALFGSVETPLIEEVPRFKRYRAHGVAILHECKDVDLAVWVSDTTCLKALQKARGQALNYLYTEREIGVAHHQVDVFIINPDTDRYIGNLCSYGVCPKGKEDCYVSGCGETPYLKTYEDFTFHDDALSSERIVVLYDCKSNNETIVR